MEDHGLSYGLLQTSEVDPMVRLLATAFSVAEPPAVAMGLSYDELAGFVGLLAPRAVDDGLTVVARDCAGGELVGVVLTDDFAAPSPIDLHLISKRFLPIFAMLDALDAQYRHGRTIVPGQHLHLFMLAVDARFAGQGIAQRLVETCLENGRKKGYRHAVTEATGVISQRVFRKLGFEERHRVSYRDYSYGGEAVFASIVGHDGAALMERMLR
jgi:ribosomal protein S18 acetylase RimI-like enzyme